MSYLTQSLIAGNSTMQERIAQCATEEGIDNPDTWMLERRRRWGAAPGWDEAWEYALNLHPPASEPHYDPAADPAVITDGMILAQVQAMRTQDEPEPPPE